MSSTILKSSTWPSSWQTGEVKWAQGAWAISLVCALLVKVELHSGSPPGWGKRGRVIVGGLAHVPWDWRILVNGYADQMAYERVRLEGGLPFDELKHRAHINDAARAADQAPDFSRRIRVGLPGFE